MLADFQPAQDGYAARFERHWQHTVEEVWSWLTENDKLVQWFPELEVEELREGGIIKFNMPDGKVIPMDILELSTHEVLAFTWAEDRVRFELAAEPDGGCRLLFTEQLQRITAHTPRDLAGWHVCLDVIEALMDGRTIASRKELWSEWYEKYKQLTGDYLSKQE
ncbi:activator of Hsp90 ATPase 1 family protein [Paenibacillus pectinilyticus]|uniref:Activator of Hsp90 ATPase 1 family protein n=1 Tax=Paenibacillus pectinilyticus TaxID=512399 RepID=A0A1C1A6X9_9BACL|nr:SRPBCC family protein [Paenibacillus pectinilyticus]OCT16321.1 activator of Hsp90 ATPase 1 family protein [Paenibacillus pectinilyticus]